MMIGFTLPQLSQKKADFAQRRYLKAMEHHSNLNEGKNQLASSSNPLSEQIGGSHYKTMKIQPIEFIMANDLDFCQGNIVKYTCRYKQKGGVEDLNKVIHYARLLIDNIEKGTKE